MFSRGGMPGSLRKKPGAGRQADLLIASGRPSQSSFCVFPPLDRVS